LELTVIELFLKDLSASDRFWLLVVFCLTLVTLTRLVLIDFFVALIQGSKPEKVVEYRTNCDEREAEDDEQPEHPVGVKGLPDECMNKP
jgi:hypothetical protein